MPLPTDTLVIFDCDGVLVDSEPIVFAVFVEVAVTPDTFTRWIPLRKQFARLITKQWLLNIVAVACTVWPSVEQFPA